MIILSVPIFMMNSKDSWFSIISTVFACYYFPSFLKTFPYRSKGGFPDRHTGLINTGFTAIFPLRRWRVKKFLAAMKARIFLCSFNAKAHCLIVTIAGTVFCSTYPGGNIRKNLSAYLTSSCNLFFASKPVASTGTIFEFINPILRNIDFFVTKGAVQCCPSLGLSHWRLYATIKR